MRRASLRLALTHVHCWPEVRRGGERYLHELAAALARRGHRITVISSADRPGRSVEDGVRVVRLPRARGRPGLERDSRFGRQVLPRLLAGRYDAVHSLGPSDAAASTVAASVHRRRRTVYTDLGIPDRDWVRSRPDAAAHARVVRDIDIYGCLSRFATEVLRRDFGREGILTPGGVRVDRFRPSASRTEQPTLLYSGTLDEPRKGVGTLLAAVAELAKIEPAVRLWLSGPGDATGLLAAAPRAARERTELLPLGAPEEQPERYGRAWVTVLPATLEAFGLALLESMACGTPVVAADHASLPELVSPETGALAQPGDVEDLTRACVQALALAPRTATVDACRATATRYDWDTAIAPRMEAIYGGG